MKSIKNVKPGDYIKIYLNKNNDMLVAKDNNYHHTAVVRVLAVRDGSVYYAINNDTTICYSGSLNNITNTTGFIDVKEYQQKGYNYKSCGTHCFYEDATAAEFGDIDNSNFWGMMKSDLNQAAYRSGATQLSKATKAGMVALMHRNKSENADAAAKLLDTDLGEALISLMLGYSLTYAPNISEDERVKKLASEFRSGAMSTGMNVVIQTLMENIYPVIKDAMSSLSEEETKIRVEELSSVTEEDEEQSKKVLSA